MGRAGQCIPANCPTEADATRAVATCYAGGRPSLFSPATNSRAIRRKRTSRSASLRSDLSAVLRLLPALQQQICERLKLDSPIEATTPYISPAATRVGHIFRGVFAQPTRKRAPAGASTATTFASVWPLTPSPETAPARSSQTATLCPSGRFRGRSRYRVWRAPPGARG